MLNHQKGEYRKSLPLLEKVTLLQPQGPDAHRLLGIDRFHAGQVRKVLEPVSTVLEANPEDSEANFCLGLRFLALDRENEANKAFDRLAAGAPANADEPYRLVKGYSEVSSAMLSCRANSEYRNHSHGWEKIPTAWTRSAASTLIPECS